MTIHEGILLVVLVNGFATVLIGIDVAFLRREIRKLSRRPFDKTVYNSSVKS